MCRGSKGRGRGREGKEGGKLGFRQWSRQLRYQLRVQAVAVARRVKEERSGNRRVNGGGMTPFVRGPGVDRPRDLVMMNGIHRHVLLSADISISLQQCADRGTAPLTV